MKTRVWTVLPPLVVAFLLLPLPRAEAQSFTNLHSFVFTNGTGPVANLIQSGNTLFGTTRIYGGGNAGGYGSAFKMEVTGSNFTVLNIFSGEADGGNLNGGLVLAGPALYGTATFGGASNHGCIFGISTNGVGLTNLYNFPPIGVDFPGTNLSGAYPAAGLVLAGNTLYATASGGGAKGWGCIFSINTNGSAFTNLHDFNYNDGQSPSGDLLFSAGTLYGTTPGGGASGYGTIFKINPNGTGFTNFYSFSYASGSPQTNADGAFPHCGLVLSGNTLYGTTTEGGDFGSGTIFKVNTDGSGFETLHHFAATSGPLATNSDGAQPRAGLMLAGTTLYGVASQGGSAGNGTVFQIYPDGLGFTTLHHFTATNGVAGTNTDGAHPVGGLLWSAGAVLGTASAGGAAGYGTLFSIALPPQLAIARAGTNAILSWPVDVTAYNLESTTNLVPPVFWEPLAGQHTVTNPISGRQKFYRLIHQ